MQDYDLVLVSIEPVVVVVVKENKEYVYFHHRLASLETLSPRYHQGIERGSEMPYSPDLYWFTPELGGGVRHPDLLSETRACLNLSEGAIQLTRTGETWVAARVESCQR